MQAPPRETDQFESWFEDEEIGGVISLQGIVNSLKAGNYADLASLVTDIVAIMWKARVCYAAGSKQFYAACVLTKVATTEYKYTVHGDDFTVFRTTTKGTRNRPPGNQSQQNLKLLFKEAEDFEFDGHEKHHSHTIVLRTNPNSPIN